MVKQSSGKRNQNLAAVRKRQRENLPTKERFSRGKFVKAKDGPAVDLHCDKVAQMYGAGILSYDQEQAARRFQELHRLYLAELPDIGGFRSCLNISGGGYDGSDGRPEVAEAYSNARKRLGSYYGAIHDVIVSDQWPKSAAAFKTGLDRLV